MHCTIYSDSDAPLERSSSAAAARSASHWRRLRFLSALRKPRSSSCSLSLPLPLW